MIALHTYFSRFLNSWYCSVYLRYLPAIHLYFTFSSRIVSTKWPPIFMSMKLWSKFSQELGSVKWLVTSSEYSWSRTISSTRQGYQRGRQRHANFLSDIIRPVICTSKYLFENSFNLRVNSDYKSSWLHLTDPATKRLKQLCNLFILSDTNHSKNSISLLNVR